jgi:hypothetical protein
VKGGFTTEAQRRILLNRTRNAVQAMVGSARRKLTVFDRALPRW